jgi:lactoylglutathione lyase
MWRRQCFPRNDALQNRTGYPKKLAAIPQPEEAAVSEHEAKMIILSTDDLDESIRFYSETLGMALKFRDGAHFAALDGGPITLALATAVDHPIPGQVVVGIKTNDVDAAAQAIEASGGGIAKGPYDDAHERRAVVYDNNGNGLVFYSPLSR